MIEPLLLGMEVGPALVGSDRKVQIEPVLAGKPTPETRSSQLSVRDIEGNIRTRWGGPDPCEPGSFASPHGLWLDSRGDLYVGEVCYTAWASLFPDTPKPKRIRSLQKYERVQEP